MKQFFVLLPASLLLLFLPGCNLTRDPYSAGRFYTPAERDTLLVDMLTYIYPKPANANHRTRHSAEFRKYYTDQLHKFEIDRYFIDQDSTHYFLLIQNNRPSGESQRGIGGRFKLDERHKMHAFEELYNTPLLPAEEARIRGRLVFEEMIRKNGNISRYLGNEEVVERPDNRIQYDRDKQEWRRAGQIENF